ncbi:MAG: hypothetical protein RLP44_25620 [Aggregatilineales bacterium]
MNVEKVMWGGWQNCYKLSNNVIELIVTADIGPRIISSALKGGKNVFATVEERLGRTGDEDWLNYGGHRLWHAPEHPIRTYQPDNHPVDVQQQANGDVKFVQPIEVKTGLQKVIHIESMPDNSAQVKIHHQLINQSLWDVELAVWGLSVMRAGGVAVIPLPERGSHPEALLPNTRLIFWPYSDLSDPRWTFGREYILLQQDKSATSPQKIGGGISDGWLAYINEGTAFIKQFDFSSTATYPDLGCNAELFTSHWMLELESMSALRKLLAGDSVVHTETWSLIDNIAEPTSEAQFKQDVLPQIQGVLQ